MTTIDSSRLPQHLASGELADAYLLTGSQPYLQAQDRDALRAALACEERSIFFGDSKTAVEDATAAAATGSLFSSSILIELLYPGEVTQTAAGGLLELAQAARDNNARLIVACAGLQNAYRWKDESRLEQSYTRIDQPEIDARLLPGWIEARARRLGLKLESEAAGFLASRTEGNPDMAAMELEMLLLRYGEEREISLAEMQGGGDDSVDSVFTLNAHLARLDDVRAMRALRHLRATREPEVLVIWSLMTQFRAMLGMQGRIKARSFFPASTQRDMRTLAKRMISRHLLELVASLSKADLAAKGLAGKQDTWIILERICAAFIYAGKYGTLQRGLLRF